MDNVQFAVGQSLYEKKTLVVYNCTGLNEDSWLRSWFKEEELNDIKDKAIWLRLIKGTEQFDNFEQLFPAVVVPSLYLINSGQIHLVIQGAQHESQKNESEGNKHWNDLLHALEKKELPVPEPIIANDAERKPEKNPKETKEDWVPKKTEKEKIMETTQEVYHKEFLKQRKLDTEERARILRLLKADKEERKAREHYGTLDDDKPLVVQDNIKDLRKLHSDKCTLQVKLTNGDRLVHAFNSNELLYNVRKWVDDNRTDGSVPYYFHRNIPRITFVESDELKTLEGLELTPRSALILKPIETGFNGPRIVEAQAPSLVSRVFGGLSTWLNKPSLSRTEPEDDASEVEWEDAQTEQQSVHSVTDEPKQKEQLPDLKLRKSNTRVSELSREDEASRQSSRAVTPNVFQFVNQDDMADKNQNEKSTYNGNNVNLEKNKDKK